MKKILTCLLLFITLPILARGGGDSGGGPTIEFKLSHEASRIEFGDMYLMTEDPKVSAEKQVKIVVKYKIPERVCRDSRNGKRLCFNRNITHYKRLAFDEGYFPNDTIERLKSRKLFSKKQKYIELANESAYLGISSEEKKQVVTVEIH